MKEQRIDGQNFIRKIEKLLYKKIIRKNNLILLGDFSMTLGNKDRSTGSKGFCESQEELMSFITEFDLEDLWRPRLIRTFEAGVILSAVLTGLTQVLT